MAAATMRGRDAVCTTVMTPTGLISLPLRGTSAWARVHEAADVVEGVGFEPTKA
jgi:hypothetical protein